MTEEGALVQGLFESLVADATRAGMPEDVLGRLIIDQVVRLWSRNRSFDDIRSELLFLAENVDPDTDHEFMRP